MSESKEYLGNDTYWSQDRRIATAAQDLGFALATGKPPAPSLEAFVRQVQQPCEDCYGTGRDIGHPGHPIEAPDCSHCGGTGGELVNRNYLAEALGIASNPESQRTVSRDHLVAVIQYCRACLSAAVSLPDVHLKEVA